MFSDEGIKSIVDLDIVSVEDCSSGTCMPPSHHPDGCPHVYDGAYCGNLGEGAALCVHEHEPEHSWEFTACLLANNGWTPAGQTTGLSQDDEFDSVMLSCANSTLTKYSFDDLTACYTGAEGDSYRADAYTKSNAKGIEHPTWLYVNGEFIGQAGKPDPTADLTEPAQEIKTKICGAYGGDLPNSCTGLLQV